LESRRSNPKMSGSTSAETATGVEACSNPLIPKACARPSVASFQKRPGGLPLQGLIDS
jgi:hypothetical protein